MKKPTQFKIEDVVHFEKKCVYQGFFKLYHYQFQYKQFNGDLSQIVTRDILERGDAVIVLAYDPNNDAVVLIEQLRIGVISKAKTPWMLELIAGIIDKEGESEFDVARREAQEEAGIDVFDLRPITRYFASPGGCSEQLTIMVARVDSASAKGIHGLAEESEDIKVHVVPRTDAYQWIEDGFINNAGTIIALQWLELNHQKLREEWSAD